jgi:hypothetical protein
MIRHAGSVALILGASGLAGCAFKGTSFGSGGFSVGDTQGEMLSRDGRVVAVLWADDNAGGGSSGGPDRVRGEMRTRDGRAIAWQVFSTRSGVGTVLIEGKSYYLAEGALFLISTRGGGVRVRQLALPPALAAADGFDAAREKLRELATTDVDLVAFVRSAAGAK